MQKIVLLLILALSFSCQKEVVERGPSSVSMDSSPSLWSASKFPLNLNVDQNSFSPSEVTNIQNAAGTWNQNFTGTNFFTINTSGTNKVSSLEQYNDGVLGIYKIGTSQWPSGLSKTALAVTQIFGYKRSGYIEIYHADILVNYDFFSFRTGNSGSGYDLETVILHELGHFLGLYHDSTNINSIMYPYIGMSTNNRTPYQTDLNNIANKYSGYTVNSTSQALTGEEYLGVEAINQTDDEEVYLQIELMADGKCKHYQNGEIIHEH